MSSQGQGIELRHAPDNKGYRLIELPPELQSLLESDNPPLLRLESTDTSAVLKSPQKTYALRQKNTSNAIFILQTRPPGPSNDEESLVAIATLHETVEVDPVRDVESTAVQNAANTTGSKGKWHERFGRNR